MVLDLQKRPLSNTLCLDMWCVDAMREACRSFCFLTVSGVLTVWQVSAGALSLLAARPHEGGTRGTIELESVDIAAIGSEILYTSLTFQFLALASLDPVFTHHELRSFCAEVLLLGI
jgi:hypothetical protein